MEEFENFIKSLQDRNFGIVWEISAQGDSIHYKASIIYWPSLDLDSSTNSIVITGNNLTDMTNWVKEVCERLENDPTKTTPI